MVGSASLNPTLVIPMRQEREAVEAARLHGESVPVVYPNEISVV